MTSPCVYTKYRMAGIFGGKIFLADYWKYVIWRNLLCRRASLSHNDIHNIMANQTCAGNLPGRELVSAQLRQNWWWNATENLTNRCYTYSWLFLSHWSLHRPHTRRLDRLPCVDRQANSFPTSNVQNSGEVMPSYAAFNGELYGED